jgi:hypothetical protein
VSRDILLQVFALIIFPQTPENNIRVISKIRGDIQKSRCTTVTAGVADTGGK